MTENQKASSLMKICGIEYRRFTDFAHVLSLSFRVEAVAQASSSGHQPQRLYSHLSCPQL